MAKESDDALVLRELVPADPLLPEPGMPPWAWVAIAVAIVAIVGTIFFIRRVKSVKADPRHLKNEAYNRAQKELQNLPEGGMQAAATRVSLILRRYLATVCGDPALFETHEEFVSRHAALSAYPEEVRNVTAEGFSHLARLKYGRDAEGDPAALAGAARQLLDRLHQHQLA
ncbi:hypothetical protein OKA04_01035 [Luteolibacter flavescens]|uniref:DUF4381 domain-containing protein n=1 Tax=Luteolibacter flavescens TaxID=1859460 RepID=A0ABT3FI90_9BACT|nr:hypothetical protein [Luteolibacter flavescens]MCW1883292.1 hypothetical protein [Luteolibacter flavescens]